MGLGRKSRWALIAGAGLVAASLADADGFRRYYRLRQDVVALEERNRALGERNAELAKEISAIRSDPRAMERAVREELGFVRPGEIVFNLEVP